MSAPSRVAVILAGGSGERFWPLSTATRPKQLLNLTHPDRSLLEEAILRAEPLFGRDHIFVATSVSIGHSVRDSGLTPSENVLIEPSSKNTLGAICWALTQLQERGFGQDTVVAILTADHLIRPEEKFRATVKKALDAAERTQDLVTIGIRPARPETGYGYIELGDETAGIGFEVLSFKEKPNLETAEKYLSSGGFLWNSGMFFWTVGAFWRELRLHRPEVASIAERLDANTFEELPRESIDFALLERSKSIKVVPADFVWDDVGSWDALARSLEASEAGNVSVGSVAAFDTSDCILYSEGLSVGVIGVQGLIVVATPDGVLVCSKEKAQEVRRIVERFHEQRPK